MANSINRQINIFAKEALRILENELVMTKKVHTDYDQEFKSSINGYKRGDTISITRPANFEVTDGPSLSTQDLVEGSVQLKIDKQKHVDVNFTNKELTLDIDQSGVRERALKPAMVNLANQIDMDIMELYTSVPNWVGTPGEVIDSFNDFSLGPKRLDQLAVPQSQRCGVLSSDDHWGLLGSQTALYIGEAAKDAYRMGKLGNLGGVETYQSQNVPTHTVGVATGTPLVNGAGQNVTYESVKDNYQQTLNTDGWTNSTTGILKAGDVFTIAGVYAVNPVTGATENFLRQFAVLADANSGASTGPAALTITPPIITSGSQKTCSAVPADNAAITVMGTGGTGYKQNLVFHRNAFAFASVPLSIPPSAYRAVRETYKGISLRLMPFHQVSDDTSGWRFDVLYGVKAIDPRLATRLSGTA